jgi:hypothetical protein
LKFEEKRIHFGSCIAKQKKSLLYIFFKSFLSPGSCLSLVVFDSHNFADVRGVRLDDRRERLDDLRERDDDLREWDDVRLTEFLFVVIVVVVESDLIEALEEDKIQIEQILSQHSMKIIHMV